MFVTFYSYKGGVGRSLALANVACLMAEDKDHPQRVLVWDFDLEAPGLHKLFPPTQQPQNYGFLDFVYEYATTGNILEIEDYIYESAVEGVYVLPAGKVGEAYCKKLQQINWVEFFGSDPRGPGFFFEKLLESIKEMPNPFDYVLIDSRTGLNDQAGISTQVLSDLLIALFRLSEQNLDGLEHLVPAIKNQLKIRGKEDVQILPIASQVGAAASQGLSLMKEKAENIFSVRDLEYIRFDEDLVSKEKLFCLRSEIKSMWPCPPIVEDYRRICLKIREQNKDDTKTQAEELRLTMRERDIATATTLLLRLLPKRPRLRQAWNTLAGLLDDMSESRKQEFNKIVSEILRKDSENFFAHQWKAIFRCFEADSPESSELEEAQSSLDKAIEYAPESERGSIFRALASIESCRGNHENGVSLLRKAQELLPKNNQISLDLAMMHMRMGAKYFVSAAEELDEIPPDIVREKYCSLAYLRTFLGEFEKASIALEHCDEKIKPMIQAHVLLIQGKREEALELAQGIVNVSSLEWADWTEVYLCAEDFEKALSLAASDSNSRKDSKGDIDFIVGLVELFEKKTFTSEDMESVIAKWDKSSWYFRELLMFRECCIRDGKDYEGRLDIIERLIRVKELKKVKSSGIGLLYQRAGWKRNLALNMRAKWNE